MADKKIELTEEQLQSLIATAAKAGAEAALANGGTVKKDFATATPNEQFQAMMDEKRGKHLPALETSITPGIVSPTGSSFDALKDHNGRVRELLNYKEPKGYDVHQDDGGLATNGLQIKDPETGQLTPQFKQHVYENYFQADINTFIGKPLPAYFVPKAA